MPPAGNSLPFSGPGSVGIGTTAPNSPLQVSGAVALACTTARADLLLGSAYYTVRCFGGCSLIALPAAGTGVGRIYIIISANASGPPVTLAVVSGGGIYDDVTDSSITSLAPNSRITV